MHLIADDVEAIARRMREIKEEEPRAKDETLPAEALLGFYTASGAFLDHLLFYYGLRKRGLSEDDQDVRQRLLDFMTVVQIPKGNSVVVPAVGGGLVVVVHR